MASDRFWEDDLDIDPQTAARYYDYFAALFLEAPPVPGDSYIINLRSRTNELFDLGSAEGKAMSAVCEFLDFSDAEAQERQRLLAVDRTGLFRGVDPDGLQPPYASFWSDAGQGGLAYAVSAYRTCGFSPTDANHEREDYAGCELAFLACLASEEALAEQKGDAERAADLRVQRQAFVSDHIAVWIPRYCQQADGYAKTGFFKGTLQVMLELVAGPNR